MNEMNEREHPSMMENVKMIVEHVVATWPVFLLLLFCVTLWTRLDSDRHR